MVVSAGVRWDARSSAGGTFDPDMTHAMSVAFDGARWVLGLASKSSDMADRLAQLIVAVAMTGERNPWRLRAAVLRRFEPLIQRPGAVAHALRWPQRG